MAFFTSFIFVISLTLQTGFGYSALGAGLIFTPMAVLAMVTSLAGKRLTVKYGLRVMTAGAAITGLSVLLVAVGLQAEGHRVAVPWLLTAMGLMGAGNGLILPSLVGAPMAGITSERAGVASGTLSTIQQFAAVAGVAVVGGIYFAVLDRDGYAAAAEVAAWIGLVLVLTVMVLAVRLARAVAAQHRPQHGQARGPGLLLNLDFVNAHPITT